MIGGDFNMVLDVSERIGSSYNLGAIRTFTSFLSKANVVDLPLQGMSFTWTNSRETAAWSRLDRFLISPSLPLNFLDLIQCRLPKGVSDHN